MPSLLQTGLSGLIAFQRTLSTTSHNIANAHTTGYTRQRTDLVPLEGQAFGNGYFGRGVGVSDVVQMRDKFVEQRLQDAITDSSRSDLFMKLSEQINNLLGQPDSGLAPALQEFFNGLHDVSTDPSSATMRQLLLSQSQTLVDRFQFLDGQLRSIMRNSNRELEIQVADVNAIAGDIARLNRDIVNAQGADGRNMPNDLIDQRSNRINELAAFVSVSVVAQDNGAINVFVGNGQQLVVNTTAQTLGTRADTMDSDLLQVTSTAGATTVQVSDQLNGGAMGALLDFRRDSLIPTRNELGRIAMVVGDSFNTQHRKGMDASGSAGIDFFTLPPPQIIADLNNVATATPTVTITDSASLLAADYRLDYDGATFTLTRSTDGASVSGPGPLSMDGLQVAIGGVAAAGDSFLIRPVARGAELFGLAIKDPDLVAAAVPVQSNARSGNLGNALAAQPAIQVATNPALRDNVDIIFNNPPTNFDVVDVATSTVIAAGVSYVNGQTFSYNGWSTSISGSPVGGDVFSIGDNTGGTADNRNALLLAGLQGTVTVAGNLNYGEAYSNLVGRVGIETRSAQLNSDARSVLLDSAMAARDEVSGVNLDEEAIDLTRYQQAYQAMAQVINTSNALFDTLITAIR